VPFLTDPFLHKGYVARVNVSEDVPVVVGTIVVSGAVPVTAKPLSAFATLSGSLEVGEARLVGNVRDAAPPRSSVLFAR
jgi:hypothetical protein